MKSTWKKFLPYAAYTLLASGILYGLLKLILSGYTVAWTGFQTKTLWDWMELLVIPIVLALGAFFLNRSERAVERETINKRAELERQIAKDRQQEAALQSYLDRMSELLVEKKLQGDDDQDEVKKIARMRTITILRALDVNRNNLVIDFLRDANLVTDESSIFNGAKIERVNLSHLDLSKVFLQGANLEGAIFEKADLHEANLAEANMSRANLNEASLHMINLQNTNLHKANIQKADLWKANLQYADLRWANLQGTDLRQALLWNADLSQANLRNANLEKANLQEAKFYWKPNSEWIETEYRSEGANLEGANLQDANLKGAKITPEQLAQAKSLKGATMPDGTIHE